MELLWPTFLLLLLLVPLTVAAYVWVLRRRKRFAVHYSSLSLIREAMPGRLRWRRHVPFALFLLAVASLVLALTRPVASIEAESNRATIMLALDVSLSMCATDIEPNRFTVAQDAAKSFIRNQGPDSHIGIVAFAGFAELVVPPTSDKDELLSAVDSLAAARRTAIGSAILRSIGAIAEINEDVAPVEMFVRADENGLASEVLLQPDIIVLLTDGRSNSGALPLNAAQAAVDRGIRVYTIGFGTPQGSVFRCTERQLAGIEFGTRFGRFFRGGFARTFRGSLDDDTLREVASMTDAEYYLAESADELLDVFANLPAHRIPTTVKVEVSALFIAVAALAMIAAIALGQRWNPLPMSGARPDDGV